MVSEVMYEADMEKSYRLGILGNLVSEELRNAGYVGNNSLRDQKCALQWVKRHIGAFGGDEENVTAFGESAGAGRSIPSGDDDADNDGVLTWM
jgi:carboxylesterase type B